MLTTCHLHIWILNLKQQCIILQCICCLTFEKSLFNIKFSSFIFHSKLIAHTAEKDQIKYVAQNSTKIAFIVKTAAWRSCYCHNLHLFKSVGSCKRLFHNLGNCKVLKCITLWTNTPSDRIHLLLDVLVAAIYYFYSSL